MKYPKTILDLIECYKKFPGIGSKTAERMALNTLNFEQNTIDLFCESLKNTRTKIRRCEICNNLSEDTLCEICKNTDRNKKILCVVEDPKNVILIENLGIFDGYYYVLSGLISPIDGINPEDINIDSLIEHIKSNNIEEVILALKPSIEGETTSLYICKLLENVSVSVSKLASGIPMGAEMDYVDSLTLEMALQNRTNIN